MIKQNPSIAIKSSTTVTVTDYIVMRWELMIEEYISQKTLIVYLSGMRDALSTSEQMLKSDLDFLISVLWFRKD